MRSFNSELGKANCLAGSSFYLGLDANEGSNIDFVATLLHEMGHGLGFQTFTNGATGAQFAGYPSVWDHNLLDNTTNKLWVNMTDAERAASSLKPSGLSWTGARVTAAVPSVLAATPQLRIVGAGAKSLDGDLFAVGEADFGPKLDKSPVTGQIAQVALQADSPGSACTPFNAANAAAVRRNIALVSRGTCGFAVKVKNAQDAGAIGVIVADNAPGAVAGMGGADASIMIPAVRVTQADGMLIAASLTKPNGSVAGTVGKTGAFEDPALGRRRAAPHHDVHAQSVPARFVGLALQHERHAQPADGASDQCRPDPHGDGAGRPDLRAVQGHRLVIDS